MAGPEKSSPHAARYDFRLDEHNDRIQGLDKRHLEISVKLTETSVRLEVLGAKYEEGMERVMLRLDEKLAPLTEGMKDIVGRLDMYDDQLRDITAERAAIKKHWSNAKRITVAAFLLLFGASFTRASEWIARLWGG